MPLIEVGRVCIKKLGRDAGSKAVVTKVIDGNFVTIVSSTRLKDRKCNVKHLEFLAEKIDPKDKTMLAQSLEIEEQKLNPQAQKAQKK